MFIRSLSCARHQRATQSSAFPGALRSSHLSTKTTSAIQLISLINCSTNNSRYRNERLYHLKVTGCVVQVIDVDSNTDPVNKAHTR